jgi:hypothetical protein
MSDNNKPNETGMDGCGWFLTGGCAIMGMVLMLIVCGVIGLALLGM